MSKLMNLAAILLLLVLGAGCSDDNKLDVILGADKKELSFAAKDEPQTVTLSCNTDWSAKSDKTWCKVSPTSGNGEGVLTVEVDDNAGNEMLNAVITITAGDKIFEIKVKQATGGIYEIKLPDFTKSLVYNIKDGDNKIAELCKESVPGGEAAVITLYVLEEGGKYPVSGYVVDNGGSIKYDGSGYTPGTGSNTAESIFLVKGEVKTSAEYAVAATVEPELLTDVDNNTYKITKIGQQYWMAENLKTTAFRDNMAIENPTDPADWKSNTKGAYCWYDNDIANKDIFGAFYNANALLSGRKLAPKGWHVPTQDEWTVMYAYLGGVYNSSAARTEKVGHKVKAISDLWKVSEDPRADKVTNVSGLGLLPGGYYTEVWDADYINQVYTFKDKGSYVYYWSAPGAGDYETDFWRQTPEYYGSTIYTGYASENRDGMYVRCVRDAQK